MSKKVDDTRMHVTAAGMQDGKVWRTETQDVRAIKERAKYIKEGQRGRTKDMHMVASIPHNLIQKLIDDGRLGKDFWQDKGQKAKLMAIIKSEFPDFMTTYKNIPITGKK